MWSSRPFADPTPFISGPRTALSSWFSFTWGREIWFTVPTLDVPAGNSTAKGSMFAHSGFRADSGRTPGGFRSGSAALDRRAQPLQRLCHSLLELVGVLVGPAQEQRREHPAQHREPPRHRAALDHPGAGAVPGQLVDPARAARAGVPCQ